MRVASIVLNNFKNDSRVLKTNISLQNAGYDVQVVALWEDGVEEFETVQNIPVHRMKLVSKNWSKNKLVQLIKYFEFLYRSVKEYRNNDVFHCNDLNALPVGVVIKLFFNKKAKIVYDAHEHESYRAGYSEKMQKISRWLESKLIKYADKVITVSYSIADDYEKMYNIPKPALVLNAPFYKKVEKKNIFREKFNIPKDDIIFLYQGGLGKHRGILEFANIVKNKKSMSYVVMGYGELEEKIQELAKNSQNIYFHKAVSPDILLNYTSSADIGVCIEEPICKSWDYALPNKLFEYMLSGIPVIVGGLSEMINFVQKQDIGFILKNIYNTESSYKELEKISKEYQNKLVNIEKKAHLFSWQVQEKVLISLYKDLDNVKSF
jgi:glycosyltransferase involved in cell wall biosynthesis